MNKNNSNKTSINIIHWNCRGARNKLPEIQGIANNVQILCLQKTLITPSCQFRINDFKQVNFYSTSPNIRGLCTLIRGDYNYTNLDCSAFSHPSVEILGIRIDCSLDESIYIFNIYCHPNRNTSSFFYSNLFAFASTQKYVLFIGDFNGHHSDWEDRRTDLQEEYVSRASEDYHLVIMNDGSPIFMSAPNVSSSTIDLTIASRPLAILANQVTTQDLYGSDHYPVKITLHIILTLRYTDTRSNAVFHPLSFY